MGWTQPMAFHDAKCDAREISVLIVADVRLYREGLAGSLASRPGLRVTGASATRADAFARVLTLHPDVVVVDSAMRESLELIRELRAGQVPVKILAFAVDETSSDVLRCAEAGATGYVTADASVDDLALAIERISREELVCSLRVAAQLFRRMSHDAERPPGLPALQELTIRERQVLELIREGHSNKEIGQKLNIAEPTVKNHVHHVLAKLDVPTRGQAAARVMLPAARRRYWDDQHREIS
jgi:two-component system nitrate/nitrite response regulator NarL